MIMFPKQETVFVQLFREDCSYESFISKAEVAFDIWSLQQNYPDESQLIVEREKRRNEILTKISSLRYTSIASWSWSLRWFLTTRDSFAAYFSSIPNVLYRQNVLQTFELRETTGQSLTSGFPEAVLLSLCTSDLCFSLSELNPKTVRVVSSWKERRRMSGSSKSDPVSPMIEWSCVPGCTP